MLDEQIIDMYWARSEDAITETENKYGSLCYSVAYKILENLEDSKECVNDTYLKAWNSMPVQRPDRLSAFLAKITRNLALTRYEYYTAAKRGGTQTELVLDELADCISGGDTTDSVVDEMYIADILNSFLKSIGEKSRNIFVSRYFHMFSVKEISERYGLKESYVKVSLHRSREILRDILKREGVCL